MNLDTNSCHYYDHKDLFALLYQGKEDLIPLLPVENEETIRQFASLNDLTLKYHSATNKTNYDLELQKHWFLPEEYKDIDIEGFLVHRCPKQNYQRLINELNEFKARNMLDLLRWLKYCVDICQSNKIVLGVGRGSSVASYVLYLLGVHKIDSVKYNLDFSEFMR